MKNAYIISFVTIGLALSLSIMIADDAFNDGAFVQETNMVPVLPDEPYNYSDVTFPPYYSMGQGPGPGGGLTVLANDNMPLDNVTTDHGATLGRVLFYDKKLSANGTVACASCHDQEHGFADSEQFSLGFDGGRTRRHSMGIINARWYQTGKFFWDERASTLEDQVLMPFQDEVEMGLTLEQLVSIVKTQPYYSTLFTNAFGDSDVTTDRISKALAQFVRSIVSFNSKYDQGRAQVNNPREPFANFTAEENRGKLVFFNGNGVQGGPNCAGCHATDVFLTPPPPPGPQPEGATGAFNNGLDSISTDDRGIAETTGRQGDEGKFKSPALASIGVRPPYMHDGRFSTLEEVVEHYSTGVQAHPQLSNRLKTPEGNPVRFNFSDADKAALVAFLHTLTDESLLNDVRFSDPFQPATSVEDLEEMKSFAVYPNPATDYLTVDVKVEGSHTVNLYDAVGRKMISVEGTNVPTTLNLKGLPNGTYYVGVSTGADLHGHTKRITVNK